MAIVDTNNFASGLRRAAADFNSYYLLGYTSTNGKPDGRYRKIKVTVKRPGVQVRAREGYLARRADEGPAKSTSNSASPGASGSTSANPTDAQLTAALGRLTPSRPDVPLVVPQRPARCPAARRARSASSRSSMPRWQRHRNGPRAARRRPSCATPRATPSRRARPRWPKGARTVEIEVPVVEGMAGDVKVQVRLSGNGPLARYTDTTSVRSTRCRPAGARRA